MSNSPVYDAARRKSSVRLKLFALAGVGILTALAASALGLTGLARVDSDVVTLDLHVARPFSDFANLRDAEGDSRVNVWTYVAATSAKERAGVADEITISDAAVHDAVAAYLADHGGAGDEQTKAMNTFASDFEAWKKARDTVVRPAADAGDTAAAYAAMSGPLNAANEAMGLPLDSLFTAEQKQEAAVAAQAQATYHQVRVRLAVAVGVGLLLAVAAAWFLTRQLLGTIAVVRESLARLAARDLTWR
ncbi:MCP four helix bundle domain-containing protein, partial [Pengzhenrongella sp.]|uniref:MCP four helix bundle domain-containing protein n=1 Tax=Pengzhenrongella sp. TaxID=2888820 RepID=UPI002F93A71E